MIYVIKDAEGYLAGRGTGTVLSGPAGTSVAYLETSEAEFDKLLAALPGWAGNPRLVKLDDKGLPELYNSQRQLPAEELEAAKADNSRVEAADRWASGVIRGKTPQELYDLVQGRIDGWASLADAQQDLRELLPLIAVGLAWLAMDG